MKLIFGFLIFAGSVANASSVTINPGDSITVGKQSTVYCADSQSNNSSSTGVCQSGPFACVGQAPGSLCGVANGAKSYCVQVKRDPYGNISCSCDH